MGILAAYSVKSAVLLSALFAIYMLTLGRQKLPSLRRFMLLGICIASLCLPLLYVYGMYVRPVAVNVEMTLPTPTITLSENFTPFIFTVIAAIIAAGICAGTLISIVGLIRILTLHTTTAYRHGHKLKLLDKGCVSPFCFCGCIYVSKENLDYLPEMILTHENSHIRHLHFVDILIGRLTLILQWWNPLAWMLTKEMQLVHEYQADNDVLNAGYDSKEYQYLLLSRATGDSKFSLTSGFRHSELKHRLKMINRNKSGRRTVATFLMLIPSAIIAVALPTSPIISYINGSLTPVRLSSLKNEPRKDTVKTAEGQPQVFLDGTALPYDEINTVNPKAIESISVWKDRPEYPNGVIEIKTKPGTNRFQPHDDSNDEEIKVLGYGVERKNPNPLNSLNHLN